MWFFVFIAIAIIGYLIFSQVLDRETKKNFSFLLKIATIIFIIILLFCTIIILKNS